MVNPTFSVFVSFEVCAHIPLVCDYTDTTIYMKGDPGSGP